MAAILLGIRPGDEVIMPSFTFVSTANAFVLRGARIVFADSEATNPNIDPQSIGSLITPRTKAIVVVHYAGIACDMDAICAIAEEHGIPVVEDAAHAIDSTYRGRPLGSFGQLATFSFHETKNIICGEGGLLVVNDPSLIKRAEIIWEKGTNRAAFARGEVQKYNWVDIGSSFLPSEIVAAFLFAQLEKLDTIQNKRKEIWFTYQRMLQESAEAGTCALPFVPEYATVNGHIFYLLCKDSGERDRLIEYLKVRNIHAVFHYLPLHRSPYYQAHFPQASPELLPNAERYAHTLLRLPLFYDLGIEQAELIATTVHSFYLDDKDAVDESSPREIANFR